MIGNGNMQRFLGLVLLISLLSVLTRRCEKLIEQRAKEERSGCFGSDL